MVANLIWLNAQVAQVYLVLGCEGPKFIEKLLSHTGFSRFDEIDGLAACKKQFWAHDGNNPEVNYSLKRSA